MVFSLSTHIYITISSVFITKKIFKDLNRFYWPKIIIEKLKYTKYVALRLLILFRLKKTCKIRLRWIALTSNGQSDLSTFGPKIPLEMVVKGLINRFLRSRIVTITLFVFFNSPRCFSTWVTFTQGRFASPAGSAWQPQFFFNFFLSSLISMPCRSFVFCWRSLIIASWLFGNKALKWVICFF